MTTFSEFELHIRCRIFIACLILSGISYTAFAQNPSMAHTWSENLEFALQKDIGRPTMHARHVFHAGIAMYDAWAVYDTSASTYLLGQNIGTFSSPFDGISIPLGNDAIQAAREETMSFAMSRLMMHHFVVSPGWFQTITEIEDFMEAHNYDLANVSTDYQNGGPAELGNYLAEQIIAFGLQDGANEEGYYMNQYYQSPNDTLFPDLPGNPQMTYPNRWQPLGLLYENLDVMYYNTPQFLSAEWGNVQPFSLSEENMQTFVKEDNLYNVYHNPGAPPLLDTLAPVGFESPLKWGTTMISIWQSHHDPEIDIDWDISPGSMGNVQSYPETLEEYSDFYNFTEGGDNGTGHPMNPITDEPYETNLVKRGDFTRSLAAFWNGGSQYLSIPAKWLHIANNKILNHPQFERNWMGEAEIMDTLEYDVRFFLTLGGALHDAAIAAWSIKGYYESPRPISTIRYMAELGQCTDTTLSNYHPAGIPLLEGFIEVVLPGDSLAGEELQHVGKVKLRTWRGPEYVDFEIYNWDPQDNAGAGWILAENWYPFQNPWFVSPPYGAYVSGHTLLSSAAATALEQMTGSPFFPGGLAQFEFEAGSLSNIEIGPEESVFLQYATYRDAADQCGLSRIWAGVNTPFADIPARLIGQTVGEDAVSYANDLFENDVFSFLLEVQPSVEVSVFPNPVSKAATIQLLTNQILHNVKIALADNRGRIIYNLERNRMEQGIHTLDLTDLSAGLYFVHLRSTEGARTMRVVVR